jgi:hypothetical protein
MVTLFQFMDSFFPLRFQVADAQNLCVAAALDGGFEWLLLLEHDIIMPPTAFIQIDKHIREEKFPLISGLYYTRAEPSVPLVFRGRGNGFYEDWKFGDKIRCDGVPTGLFLIHRALLQSLWDDSPDYLVRGETPCRAVFRTPRDLESDPTGQFFNISQGTSDLDLCTRIIEDGHFDNSGWTDFIDDPYPFLVDTDLFCLHVNPDGTKFPGWATDTNVQKGQAPIVERSVS